MPDCTELVLNCKGCKRFFERHERMIHCPDCGKKRECHGFVMKGYNLCKEHGGPRPDKKYYGRSKGRFSMTGEKALKSPLMKRSNEIATKYVEIQTDPNAQTLRPLHSILNARLMVLMGRAGIGDSSSRMENIVQLWIRFKKWHPNLNQYFHGAEPIKAFKALDAELEATVHDYAAWNEIYRLIDEKRKVSESEMKILKDMKALISADDAFNLVAQVLAAVTKGVDDPRKLEEIRYELAILIGDPIAGRIPKREPAPIDIRPSGMDSGQILHSRDPERPDSPGEDHDDGLSEGHVEGGVLEG